IAEAVVAGITNDADYLEPTVAPGHRKLKRRLALQFGRANLAADGLAIRKILASQDFIDNRELGSVRYLALIPDAPLQQRNAKYGEILWTDEVDPRALLFCHWLAGDFQSVLPAIVWRRGIR